MTCKRLEADGATGWICSRGAARDKTCKCGATATRLCDFPLRGRKTGQTCDRPLCDRCAVSRGEGVDYCQPHDSAVLYGNHGKVLAGQACDHGRQAQDAESTDGQPMSLNPRFVERLMGVPSGWVLSFACSETAWYLWLQRMRFVLWCAER